MDEGGDPSSRGNGKSYGLATCQCRRAGRSVPPVRHSPGDGVCPPRRLCGAASPANVRRRAAECPPFPFPSVTDAHYTGSFLPPGPFLPVDTGAFPPHRIQPFKSTGHAGPELTRRGSEIFCPK